MLRSMCYGICVLALAGSLSGCMPSLMQGHLGASLGARDGGFGPGAEAV